MFGFFCCTKKCSDGQKIISGDFSSQVHFTGLRKKKQGMETGNLFIFFAIASSSTTTTTTTSSNFKVNVDNSDEDDDGDEDGDHCDDFCSYGEIAAHVNGSKMSPLVPFCWIKLV